MSKCLKTTTPEPHSFHGHFLIIKWSVTIPCSHKWEDAQKWLKREIIRGRYEAAPCFQSPVCLFLTLISSLEPSPKNAAFYLLAHQRCKYAVFYVQTGWMCSDKKESLKSSCRQFILKSNPILKLSRITKTFKVNFSNREKSIFFSVRRCMDSILFYDIKENTHNEREAELTPLIRKSAFFLEDTISIKFVLW